MTAQTRATLKALFETGDVPDGDNYADMIDSAVNLSDTSAQSLSSELSVTKLVSPSVSATRFFGGIVSADTVHVSGNVSASDIHGQGLYMATVTVSGNVSAADVYGSNLTLVSSVNAKDATFTGAVTAATVSMGVMHLNVATTTQASGGATLASVVPTTAQGYIEVNIAGTVYVMPYFKRKSG